MSEFYVDKRRAASGTLPGTGIFVRAFTEDNMTKVASVDISELTPMSLRTWLRSRGGENDWAERVVGILLGHDMEEWPK